MARIRTIKPDFFTSADIVSLSPLARILYIATWCEADKEGRMVWRPRTFKLRYLPGDDCDIEAICDELVDGGLIVMYGDGLAYIPTFKDHQHLNPRESTSTFPEPDASTTRAPRVATRQPRVSTGADQELTHREEGKGREIYTRVDDAPSPSGSVTNSKPSKTLRASDLEADGVDTKHATDWLAVRKAKRAPLTSTAWDAVKREAILAAMTPGQAVQVAAERGWQGFKASWLAQDPVKHANGSDPFHGAL